MFEVANCWEFFKCGREAGGAKASEMGVCPAYSLGAGRSCWLVTGTMCEGALQHTYQQKKEVCSRCEFYGLFFEASRQKQGYYTPLPYRAD